jgi:hypothetical protein
MRFSDSWCSLIRAAYCILQRKMVNRLIVLSLARLVCWEEEVVQGCHNATS